MERNMALPKYHISEASVLATFSYFVWDAFSKTVGSKTNEEITNRWISPMVKLESSMGPCVDIMYQ